MVGVTLGNYRIESKLGEGGMGEVYLAVHPGIRKKVAIKVLRPEFSKNRDILVRFFNEARAATEIRHPGIINIIDYGEHPSGFAYFIMDLLEGESLSGRLKREPRMPPELIVVLADQFAKALAAAHERGIVHRDLKPDNVFLCPDDAVPCGLRIKVLDFGIAKLTDDDGVRTATSAIMGTPAYMSPEQCRATKDADQRSDVYSFGCILYQMATGQWVFTAKSATGLITAHLHTEPRRPRELVPSLPIALEAIILRCLQKDPDARYQSMRELVIDLERLQRVTGAPASVAWPEMELPPTLVSPAVAVDPPGQTRPERPHAPESAEPPRPVTTLGGAASQSVAAPRRPRATWIAVTGGVAVATGVVLAIALGSGSTEKGHPAVSDPEVTPAPTLPAAAVPIPEPLPAPSTAVDAGVTVAAPVDAGVAPPPKPTKPKTRPRPGNRWEVKEGGSGHQVPNH